MNKFWEILEWVLKILPRFVTLQPDEAGTMTRFGRCVKTLDEGGHYRLIWPVIHEITTVTMTRQIIDVPTQDVLTFDDVPVCMNISVEYIISDPYKAIFEVEDFDQCIQEMAGDMARREISDKEYDYCTVNMQLILLEILEKMQDKAAVYGIEVTAVRMPTFVKGHAIRLVQQ